MDNRYYKYGCPPLMSDARFITSWVDSDVVNQYIRHVNKITSSNDFRMFLQQNGDQIINKERAYVVKKNTCNIDGKCASLGKSDENKCRGMCKCYKD